MDSLQRNGGTAGILSAVFLALLFMIFLSTGLRAEAIADPAKVLPYIAQNTARWKTVGLAGVLGVGFAVVFTAALYSRLRDRAPTRATAMLYLVLIGLGAFGISSLLGLAGAPRIAALAASDPVAANHAYVAFYAVTQGLDAAGNGFTGAGTMLAGWAILATAALSPLIGWLAVVTGILGVLLVFSPASPLLFLGSFILTIVWLAWAGFALRQAHPVMEAARA